MIKWIRCCVIVCSDCGTIYEHDYIPHWDDPQHGREETVDAAEWWSDGAEVDLCHRCKLKPHPFRLMPNTTDECWRCPHPAEEHEEAARASGADGEATP